MRNTSLFKKFKSLRLGLVIIKKWRDESKKLEESFLDFFNSFRKKHIGWSYFIAVVDNWYTPNISQIFLWNRPLTLTLARTKSRRYIFVLKEHFIIYLIMYYLLLITKKICNLFALKNSKFLKKKILKKLWVSVETERIIFVKNKARFFHLILWTFEIKNKKGKK